MVNVAVVVDVKGRVKVDEYVDVDVNVCHPCLMVYV